MIIVNLPKLFQITNIEASHVFLKLLKNSDIFKLKFYEAGKRNKYKKETDRID